MLRSTLSRLTTSKLAHRLNDANTLDEWLENKSLQEYSVLPSCLAHNFSERTEGHRETNDANKEKRILSDARFPVVTETTSFVMVGDRKREI